MPEFELDERLRADCSLLLTSADCSYLLHHNTAVDWFILVPHTVEIEFYRLPPALRQNMCDEIARVSAFIESELRADKINVATLGNVVAQLHIHVIGRRYDDPYWPDPVWGKATAGQRDAVQIQRLRTQLTAYLHRN